MTDTAAKIDLGSLLPPKDEKKDELGPMTSFSAVFSKFGRTRKVKTFRFLGVLCSVLSGTIYPIMAFYFARSFEDLGGGGGEPGSEDGDGYMDQVRNLVFVFLILG